MTLAHLASGAVAAKRVTRCADAQTIEKAGEAVAPGDFGVEPFAPIGDHRGFAGPEFEPEYRTVARRVASSLTAWHPYLFSTPDRLDRSNST